MLEKIVKRLQKADINGWKIEEKFIEGQEYFFVKRELDLSRAKKVRHFDLTVYRDFYESGEKYRGSSSTRLSPTMSDDELQAAIDEAAFAAGFVKNPWYPLVSSSVERLGSHDRDLQELSSNAMEAIFKADNREGAWLNSMELFITRSSHRIINSEGVDVSYTGYRTYIETIVNASGKEEVELYDQLLLSLPEKRIIEERIHDLLAKAIDRSLAVSTPFLKAIPVILTGDPAKEVARYYLNQSSARMKYDRISQVEPGESVQGDERGDRINLSLVPDLEESYFSAPFDEDGFKLSRRDIVKNGLLAGYWGNLRYSSYLGVETTGSAMNFSLLPGSVGIEEMRSRPHLEVPNFSAVEVDEATGDFGGEIRLGWYFDGTKRVPVTGGSITGNLRDIESLYLSREVELESDYLGPKSMMIEGFNIAGE
ncbi:MAG TPA: metallopeptidase TldD-related protein [Mesotoga sp.]|nr:Zn-dependent protease [Mesotoga sp.]MDI9376130.1 metallopeptidase TldD-related protein [Thermotogota bacterium]MDD4040652.1 metallopeptidase TldD-related protein [Mesotoga sp.]MDD5744662.1 metallopeptidase TldD-related protein [Mesotoga sp.]HPM95629.1 metallopeptidase TldD-related protein [Mesotoga sp.]